MPAIVFEVTVLARGGSEMERRSVALSDRNMNKEAKLVEACAIEATIRGQLVGAECRIVAQKMQLANA